MPKDDLEQAFPRLITSPYKITSKETDDYNCIAWAGCDDTEKWDPDETSGRYWPKEVTRNLELQSFVELYKHEGGYSPCDDGGLEPGFEKIAIFWDLSKQVTHAARQLQSGAWTSKLGDLEDIEHDSVSSLEGNWYGTVAQFMKRPLPGVAVSSSSGETEAPGEHPQI